jgi:hypothetical protein
MPRVSTPIEMEYDNGEKVQGSYREGVFSINPHVADNDLRDRDAKPVRFRYLDI